MALGDPVVGIEDIQVRKFFYINYIETVIPGRKNYVPADELRIDNLIRGQFFFQELIIIGGALLDVYTIKVDVAGMGA